MHRWMRILIAAPLLVAATSVRAEVDGHTLLRFQSEAEAFNAEKDEANRYRAGFYYGFINGVLDALNNSSVCFSACRCDLESLISKHYQQHPEDLDKPAGPTLSSLFEKNYPCKKH